MYTRVSSVDQKNDLERQMERLKDYAAAHGYHVTRMVSEIGSGLNDRRTKFLKLLTDPTNRDETSILSRSRLSIRYHY